MKIFIAIVMFVAVSFGAQAQKIKRDEVDKYTKSRIKETNYRPLAKKFFRGIAFKIKKVNDHVYFNLMATDNISFFIAEGDKIYLLLENDSTVVLNCISGGVASYYTYKSITSWTAYATYALDATQCQTLMDNYVKGIRIDTGDSYTTFDKIKKDKAQYLPNAISMVLKDS